MLKIIHTSDFFTTRQNLRMKAFADDKLKVTEKMKICFEKGRKHVGKRENAGYQHFLLFQQFFGKASYTGLLKVEIVW